MNTSKERLGLYSFEATCQNQVSFIFECFAWKSQGKDIDVMTLMNSSHGSKVGVVSSTFLNGFKTNYKKSIGFHVN